MSFIEFSNTDPSSFTYKKYSTRHEYTFEIGILGYTVVLYDLGKRHNKKGNDYMVSIGLCRLDFTDEYEHNLYVKTNEFVKFFRTIKEILSNFTERIPGNETIRYNLDNVINLPEPKKMKRISKKIISSWGYKIDDVDNNYLIIHS